MKNLILLITASLGLMACHTMPKGIKPVAPFDIKRYSGTWYEIGRKDHKFEKGLSKVTATYVVDEKGKVRVTNKGYNVFSGEWKEAKGKAKLINDGREGRLKVSFFGPFYSQYNVIAIDPDYENAMVVGKDKSYFWLLSKKPAMPEEVKHRFLQIASEADIKTDNIIWVKQGDE